MAIPAKELLVTASSLKNVLVGRATGDRSATDVEYQELRQQLIDHPSVKAKLPECVLTCRTLFEFWGFIGRPRFDSYQERREYLRDVFDPLLTMLEASATSPGDETATEILTKLDWNEVQAAWRKALERKATDPEGAITAARALLETVCKHVLDEAGVTYDPKADLPELYKVTSKTLKMSPSQHTQDIFKQILGGCHSVVQGLGALRSKVGDAHGQGKRPVKPAPRHAELAVNLAGAMAMFIAQTWDKVRNENDGAAT